MTKAEEIKQGLNYSFYALTDGCYIIRDDDNMVVCYRYQDDLKQIDLEGENLHIVYLEGSMEILLGFCSDDVKLMSFNRNGEEKIRTYDFQRLKRRVLNKTC